LQTFDSQILSESTPLIGERQSALTEYLPRLRAIICRNGAIRVNSSVFRTAAYRRLGANLPETNQRAAVRQHFDMQAGLAAAGSGGDSGVGEVLHFQPFLQSSIGETRAVTKSQGFPSTCAALAAAAGTEMLASGLGEMYTRIAPSGATINLARRPQNGCRPKHRRPLRQHRTFFDLLSQRRCVSGP
jgi:hypothetical protein